MAVPQGRTIYKKDKKDKIEGILTVSDDQKWVTWTPLPGTGSPVVRLAMANITSEQVSFWIAMFCDADMCNP
jgi:transcription initiation factor TFIIH subunit 1